MIGNEKKRTHSAEIISLTLFLPLLIKKSRREEKLQWFQQTWFHLVLFSSSSSSSHFWRLWYTHQFRHHHSHECALLYRQNWEWERERNSYCKIKANIKRFLVWIPIERWCQNDWMDSITSGKREMMCPARMKWFRIFFFFSVWILQRQNGDHDDHLRLSIYDHLIPHIWCLTLFLLHSPFFHLAWWNFPHPRFFLSSLYIMLHHPVKSPVTDGLVFPLLLFISCTVAVDFYQ